VPLSALAVWFGVALLGLAAYNLLDSLCPPELMVSGACTAPWYASAVEGVILLCTGLAAAGIVIIPALVAPAWRVEVSTFAFACGALFAIYAALDASLWLAFVVAAIAGSISLWGVFAVRRRSNPQALEVL